MWNGVEEKKGERQIEAERKRLSWPQIIIFLVIAGRKARTDRKQSRPPCKATTLCTVKDSTVDVLPLSFPGR